MLAACTVVIATPTPEPELVQLTASAISTDTAQPTLTPSSTPTVTATSEPADLTPRVLAANSAVNLRAGPGVNFAILGVLAQGESLEIVGRNADASWWQVATDNGLQWISAGVTTATTAGDAIPIVPVPTAAPTVAPPSQPAPQPPIPVVPSANMALDYGIQVDPDGDPGFNISHIQTLGFRWIKVQMPWKEVQPSPEDFQWGHWDRLINAYHGAGLKILLSIPKAPDWARPPDDDKSVEGPPADPQTYANFVAAVAARYAGKVQAIEVWNEQNLYYEAGGQGRVNVDDYMTLLKAAYGAIKTVNPGMTVVSGALTPTGAPPPLAVDDVLYLRQMYERGLKNVSDAIGAHPSGFANAPDILYPGGDFDPKRGYDDHRSFFFRNTMEDYRRVMVEFGDGQKAIWPTEFGWPVWRFRGDKRFEFAQDNTLQEQANYIRRAYEMAQAWGWVGPMFLWNLDYAVTTPRSEMANFGILTRSGLTPAFEALRTMPKDAPPTAVIQPQPTPTSVVPPTPTATPLSPHQYTIRNIFGQVNEAITQIRGDIRDGNGQPVDGVRVRVRSGSFCTVSYPSGPAGGYPAGVYDILLDNRAKDGAWQVAVVNGPADGTNTACDPGLAVLSEEVTVPTNTLEGVVFVEWRKNY